MPQRFLDLIAGCAHRRVAASQLTLYLASTLFEILALFGVLGVVSVFVIEVVVVVAHGLDAVS